MALVPYGLASVDVAGAVLDLSLPAKGTEGLRHTGRILWPACRDMVTSVLVPNRESLAGRAVLELGAGAAGIPGLAASMLGARAVLLTDTADSVPSLWDNIARNPPPSPATQSVRAAAFPWGCHDDDDGGEGTVLPVEIFDLAPDIVLCADCCFEGTERDLAATLAWLLSLFPRAEVWLVNILIPHALRAFRRELTARGLTISERGFTTCDRTTENSSTMDVNSSQHTMPVIRWRIVRA